MKTKHWIAALTLIALISLAGSTQPAQKPRWEYKVTVSTELSNEQDTLNRLAAEGWEVVAVVRGNVINPTTASTIFYLKRPKP